MKNKFLFEFDEFDLRDNSSKHNILGFHKLESEPDFYKVYNDHCYGYGTTIEEAKYDLLSSMNQMIKTKRDELHNLEEQYNLIILDVKQIDNIYG